MSHFITPREAGRAFRLVRPRGGVVVTRGHGPYLRIDDTAGVSVVKVDALVTDLPDRMWVLPPVSKGEGQIKPAPGHRFVVTVETINPRHILLELPL